jgi:hypothetical protein
MVERIRDAREKQFCPAIFLARSSLASFTWTETTKMLEPIGVDG